MRIRSHPGYDGQMPAGLKALGIAPTGLDPPEALRGRSHQSLRSFGSNSGGPARCPRGTTRAAAGGSSHLVFGSLSPDGPRLRLGPLCPIQQPPQRFLPPAQPAGRADGGTFLRSLWRGHVRLSLLGYYVASLSCQSLRSFHD